jgi:4-hydroxy 2-oxovalerate aldolase
MITGQLVEHPRSAMKARDEGDTKYVDFYKKLTEK